MSQSIIICQCDNCRHSVHRHNLCRTHYDRLRKTGVYGGPTGLNATSIEERLIIRSDRSGGPDSCWPWLSKGKPVEGYGYVTVKQKTRLAHVVSYEMYVGPVPEGLTLDHLCVNSPCINPKHLEPVTMQENILRGNGLAGQNARKTHCPKGHPYDIQQKNGSRWCRVCRNEGSQRYKAKLRGGPALIPVKDRTHCPQGHPYDEENTRIYRGMRYCRQCHKDRGRR